MSARAPRAKEGTIIPEAPSAISRLATGSRFSSRCHVFRPRALQLGKFNVGRTTFRFGRQINNPFDIEIVCADCQGIEAKRKSMRLLQEAAFNGSGKIQGRHADRIEASAL
jgi:hypothetical protein